MEAIEIINRYLREAHVMQLATVRDGKPWVCTVNYAVDDQNNLYWMSLKTRRHSLEIQEGSAAAGAIVKDPAIKQGLQFEGEAKEVSVDELEQAHKIYSERYGDKPGRLAEAQSGTEDSRTYYVLKPSLIQLHDEVNFPDNPQHQITL